MYILLADGQLKTQFLDRRLNFVSLTFAATFFAIKDFNFANFLNRENR